MTGKRVDLTLKALNRQLVYREFSREIYPKKVAPPGLRSKGGKLVERKKGIQTIGFLHV